MAEPRLIRLPELQCRIGIGKTKIYAMIKSGDFPEPVKIGKASLWSSEKVTEWIEEQAV